MPRKLLLILIIIILATLMLSVLKSRKGLWRNDGRLHIRMLTLRSILALIALALFALFTLWR